MLPLLQHLPALKQLYLQSIERHQMELPMASFASTASRLKVLQIDNVRLTAQVRRAHGHCTAFVLFYCFHQIELPMTSFA